MFYCLWAHIHSENPFTFFLSRLQARMDAANQAKARGEDPRVHASEIKVMVANIQKERKEQQGGGATDPIAGGDGSVEGHPGPEVQGVKPDLAPEATPEVTQVVVTPETRLEGGKPLPVAPDAAAAASAGPASVQLPKQQQQQQAATGGRGTKRGRDSKKEAGKGRDDDDDDSGGGGDGDDDGDGDEDGELDDEVEAEAVGVSAAEGSARQPPEPTLRWTEVRAKVF